MLRSIGSTSQCLILRDSVLTLSVSCLRNMKFILCFMDTETADQLPYHTKQLWHFSKETHWSLLLLCRDRSLNRVKGHSDNLRQLAQVWQQLLYGTWLTLWAQKHYYLDSQGRFGEIMPRESHSRKLCLSTYLLAMTANWDSIWQNCGFFPVPESWGTIM